MAFQIDQGQSHPNNVVPTDDGEVYVRVSGAEVEHRLGAAEGFTREDAFRAAVYINEFTDARSLHVTFVASGPAPVAAPVDSGATVAAPPRRWKVSAASGNVSANSIESALRAQVPAAMVNGGSVDSTLSRCGLDQFILSTWAGAARQHLVIEVRKRLDVLFIPMLRDGSTGQTFSMAHTIERALTQLADDYGIDATRLSDHAPVAYRSLPIGTPALDDVVWHHLGVTSSRPPRQLHIGAVGDIVDGQATVLGYGGEGLAILSLTEMVRSYIPAEAPDVARTTLLHEICHVFQMVPSSPSAGGLTGGSWEDSSHAHHCRINTCINWWEADHPPAHQDWALPAMGEVCGQPSRSGLTGPHTCHLFLLAVDLSRLI